MAAATKGLSSNPSSLSAGKLGEVRKVSAAIRAKNEKLIKEYDKVLKEREKITGPKKPLTIGAKLAKMKKLFNGNPKTNAFTPSQLAGSSKSIQDKIKDLEAKESVQSKTKLAKIPKFDLPKSNIPSFDLDLGDEGGITDEEIGTEVTATNKEEDLANFTVDAGEVNENQSVNIFKLISNRYLLNYPKLLEEK